MSAVVKPASHVCALDDIIRVGSIIGRIHRPTELHSFKFRGDFPAVYYTFELRLCRFGLLGWVRYALYCSDATFAERESDSPVAVIGSRLFVCFIVFPYLLL